MYHVFSRKNLCANIWVGKFQSPTILHRIRTAPIGHIYKSESIIRDSIFRDSIFRNSQAKHRLLLVHVMYFIYDKKYDVLHGVPSMLPYTRTGTKSQLIFLWCLDTVEKIRLGKKICCFWTWQYANLMTKTIKSRCI